VTVSGARAAMNPMSFASTSSGAAVLSLSALICRDTNSSMQALLDTRVDRSGSAGTAQNALTVTLLLDVGGREM
jgi:hypothetical protein